MRPRSISAKLLLVGWVLAASACGHVDPTQSALGAISSAAVVTPCADPPPGATPIPDCERCPISFRPENADATCRFTGGLYALGFGCNAGHDVEAGWVGDGDFIVFFTVDPEMYFTADVNDSREATILDWRGADGISHPLEGYIELREQGKDLDFTVTSHPQFFFNDCPTRVFISTFDAHADPAPDVEGRALEILSEPHS